MAQVLQSRKKASFEPLACHACKTELVLLGPLPSTSSLKVKCFSCGAVIDAGPAIASSSLPNGSAKPAPRKGRRIGTDAQPLDTEYYEVLGIPVDADAQAIKSAYRRLAIKLHPDKNPNDPEAAEKFKQLALAYSTLSDPVTRHRYNEYGTQSMQQEEGFVDPEAIFSQLFGGERFVDVIGTISLGQEMKNALSQNEEEEQTLPDGTKKKKELTLEERAKKVEADRKNAEARAKARKERVDALEAKLIHKLAIYTEQEPHPDVERSVREIWRIESDELKQESYGVELLQAVGNVYMAKARHFAASNSTPLGIGGWFHGVKSTAHVFSETVSTLRSAMELTDVFKELSAAEAKGISPEEKQKLEEKASQKAMLALLKGAKLEIESVIREVCDRLLEAKLPPQVLARRAAGLEILGEVYAAAIKDTQGEDSDYVRIDRLDQQKQAPAAPPRPVPPRPPGGAPPAAGPPPASEGQRPYKPYVPKRA